MRDQDKDEDRILAWHSYLRYSDHGDTASGTDRVRDKEMIEPRTKPKSRKKLNFPARRAPSLIYTSYPPLAQILHTT